MGMVAIKKYPRTPHLECSRLQPGDDRSDQASISELRVRYPDAKFVTEEKLDGANVGFFLDENLDLRLQSRGHVLTGGAREGQFSLLKQWASLHESYLSDLLEDRYVMYGEYMFAKHTVFYDSLPGYFFEFDIFDKIEDRFLSTSERHAMLQGGPVLSVPVLSEAWPQNLKDLKAHVQPSLFKTLDWRESLKAAAGAAGVDPDRALQESGQSDLSEGLYIKIETEEGTIGRYKWVRPDFLQAILESGSHWRDRPMIQNRLADGVDFLAMPKHAELEIF